MQYRDNDRLTEMQVFVLPLPLIRNLQLKYRREKIGLLSMFLLGFLTIMASVARFSVQDIVTNNLPMCKFAHSIMQAR